MPGRTGTVAQLYAVVLLAGVVLGVATALAGPAPTVVGTLVLGALGVLVALWERAPDGSRRRLAGIVAAVAAGAAGVGLVLGVVGGGAGPIAMIAVPAAAAASAAVLVRPAAAVVVVLLSVPVGLVSLPGAPLGLDVIQVVALGAVLLVVLTRSLAGQLPVVLPRPLLWAVALVPWGLVASLTAVDVDLAVRQMVALAVNVLLALVVVTVLLTVEGLRRVLWVLLAVGAVGIVPALLGGPQLQASYGGAVVAGRATAFFTQPNQLGTFTMVVALVGAGLLLAGRTPRERVLAGALSLPVVAGLLLSLSRSSWIGLLGGALVMLVLLPSARRWLVGVLVPLALLGVAVGAFAPESAQVQVVGDRVATLADGGAANPYDERPRIWAEGRRQVLLDPATGHGPGSFPVVSTRSASAASTVQADHAHDVLLTVATEFGLPGAALLVGLSLHVALATRTAVRRARTVDAPLVAGLAAACGAVAVQGVFDYTMRNPIVLTVLWVVLGLTVAATRLVQDRSAADDAGQEEPAAPPSVLRAAAG